MGILLAFMFVWNMIGALILLPALAYFLLPAERRAATGDSVNSPLLSDTSQPASAQIRETSEPSLEMAHAQ
ncbi:hypothetical protein D3C71_2141860 [compost metagenome]